MCGDSRFGGACTAGWPALHGTALVRLRLQWAGYAQKLEDSHARSWVLSWLKWVAEIFKQPAEEYFINQLLAQGIMNTMTNIKKKNKNKKKRK